MSFYDNELAAACCSVDWLNASLPSVEAAVLSRFLAQQQPQQQHPQPDTYLPPAPKLQKLSRPLTKACGANRLDHTAYYLNCLDHSPFAKTSDTDSGTATPPTVTDHFVQSHVNKQKSLYKTELCRSWEEKGRCPYGNKCQYAHGTDELRPVARHPKFKTEVCCTFVTTGTCPYGRRCRFIHKNVPITAVGKQISIPSKKNEGHISSANSITASSRRLPIFVKLARGEE